MLGEKLEVQNCPIGFLGQPKIRGIFIYLWILDFQSKLRIFFDRGGKGKFTLILTCQILVVQRFLSEKTLA